MIPWENSFVQNLNRAAEAWWPQVLHGTWQSAVVVVVVLAVIRLGRRWPSPLRYGILLVALAKFAVPPLLSLPTGMLSQVSVEVSPLPAMTYEPIASASWGTVTDIGAGAPAISPHSAIPVLQDDRGKPSALSPSAGFSMNWKTYLMLIHIFGMAIVGVWVLLGFRRLANRAKRAGRAEDQTLNELLEDLCRLLGLHQVPRLLLTDRDTAPVAFGVRRPAIMLSQCLVHQLPAGELRTVLAHELAHHRRRDPLVNCIQILLSIVWWFNPFFWLLSSQIRRVREDCCDDFLLARDVTSSDSYSETLLRSARELAALPAGTALGFAEKLHPVGRRIRRIMDPGLKRGTKISLAGLFLVVVFAAFILPGLSVREESADDSATVEAGGPDSTTESAMEKVFPFPATPTPGVVADETAEASAELGGIAGRVVRQDGNPVAGAEVIFVPHTDDVLGSFVQRGRYRETEPFAVTDASGEYLNEELAPGEYTVAFRASGYAYAEYTSTVQVKDGEITHGINRTLENAGVIFGQVIENVSGKPAEGVRVFAQIVSHDRHDRPSAVTHRNLAVLSDSDGKFRLDSLFPSERYDLITHHEVYASATQKSVPVDTGRPVRIVVWIGGTVRGLVLREKDAAPVADARVTLSLGGDVNREVRSAPDGGYLIQGLDPGAYRLRGEKEGWFTRKLPEYELEVGYASETDLNLLLVPGAVIEITVIDKETRKSIAGAEVQFAGRSETLITDEDGKTRASGFDEGELNFTVRAEGYTAKVYPEYYELGVRLGKIFEPTIELESEKTLAGIVVDEEGQPVSGAKVGVDERCQGRWCRDGDWESMTTGADGKFRLGGLSGGEYTYRVSATKEDFAPARWEGSPYHKEEIRLVLRTGATLEGTVKDKAGKGQEGFEVELDGGRREVTVLSGPDGRWKMEHIEAYDYYRLDARNQKLRTNQINNLKVGWNDHLEGIELVVREGVSISGKVVDAIDGTGIPNINVRFWTDPHISTRSDADGNFRLEQVPWGQYEFHINLPDPYIGLSRKMEIKVGSEDIEGILLEAIRGATVRGKVLLPSGEGAPGAAMLLLHPDYSVTANIRGFKTDAAGEYEITGIRRAIGVRVRADLAGYAPGLSEKINLRQGDVVEGIDIQLHPPGAVSGTVKDDQGKALTEGYYVECVYPFPEAEEDRWKGGTLGRDNPGVAGQYKIAGLPPGEVRVLLWGEGRGADGSPGAWSGRQSKLVTIESGEETTGVDFIVGSKKEEQDLTGYIAGRVVNGRGEGIEGIDVYVTCYRSGWTSEEGMSGTTTSQLDGSFRIENLVKGTFQLYGARNQPTYEEFGMEDVPSPSDNVKVVLKVSASIEGRAVRRDTGEPVTRFILDHGRPDTRLNQQVIDDPGGMFRLGQVPPGAYLLRAEAEGIGVAQRRVDLVEGQFLSGVLLELRSPYQLRGWVVRKLSRSPVGGAVVEPGTQHQAVTGVDGSFTLTGLYPGVITITVAHPDYGRARFAGIEVPEEGAAKEVLLELQEPGRIEGRVYTDGGVLYEGVELSLMPATGGYSDSVSTMTNYEGSYEFAPVAPGEYSVRWEMELPRLRSGGQWHQTVQVEPQETEIVNFGDGGVVVTGTITRGGETRPLSSVHLSGQGIERSVQVDGQGEYYIYGLPGGHYALTVTFRGFGPEHEFTKEVDLPGNGEVRMDFSYPQDLGP